MKQGRFGAAVAGFVAISAVMVGAQAQTPAAAPAKPAAQTPAKPTMAPAPAAKPMAQTPAKPAAPAAAKPMTPAKPMADAKGAMSLGVVNISRSVMADGKPLAAGNYTLRVSDEMPKAVVGQSADEARWVEFSQGGTVKGREIATVLSKDALKSMTREDKSAAPGSAKVEMLKGNDYMRVWVNHMGAQYLIHLTVAK